MIAVTTSFFKDFKENYNHSQGVQGDLAPVYVTSGLKDFDEGLRASSSVKVTLLFMSEANVYVKYTSPVFLRTMNPQDLCIVGKEICVAEHDAEYAPIRILSYNPEVEELDNMKAATKKLTVLSDLLKEIKEFTNACTSVYTCDRLGFNNNGKTLYF